jgi:hypothetical protein
MDNEKKGTEVITAEEVRSPFDLSVAAIADTNLVAIAEDADKRLAAFEKIWKGSLSRTNANDWVNEGGKPYLQASGAQKIARWLGVSWRVNPPIEEDLGGGHYLIKYTGEFALGGAVISETGSRSSKDPFFSRAKGRDLPASEIDKGNVMKAAYTNLLGRGITTLLGLRNLTWADLERYAQVNQKAVASVGYGRSTTNQGSKAPSSQGDQGKKETKQQGSPDDPATLAQAQAIHNLLKTQGIGDELSKMQKVAEILGIEEVPTAVSKLNKGQASTVIAALQKEVDEAKAAARETET